MAYTIQGEIRNKTGRPSLGNTFEEFDTYVQGVIISKGHPLLFKIDKDDLEKVKSRNWFAASDYIGSNITIGGVRKILYLHNFIMNNIVFPGRGAKSSIDHINRDGLDNRKENLRLVTQTQQNLNQKKKKRTATLPEGITEIPTHIWYIKANGAHGDRFGIDLKTEKIKWKGTSSKKLTIQQKLDEAIEKREEFYVQFPYLRK
jgi:hypothetical protein